MSLQVGDADYCNNWGVNWGWFCMFCMVVYSCIWVGLGLPLIMLVTPLRGNIFNFWWADGG